jgi:hypothetical protein
MAIIKPNNNTISAITALPAAITTGKVLQVVQTVKTDHFTSTSDGFFDITGLSVAITPSSSSNKVFVISDLAIGSNDASAYNNGFKVLRGSTSIGIGTSGTSANYSGGWNLYDSDNTHPHIFGNAKFFLDSPSTTSATTYKIQGTKQNSSGIFMVNRKGGGGELGAVSSITVMEIGA